MFKWLGKQFAYGRIYLWAKERLSGILLTLILLILVFYIHSEYLNYIEFKSSDNHGKSLKTIENQIDLLEDTDLKSIYKLITNQILK